jgi:hypothetical protein
MMLVIYLASISSGCIEPKAAPQVDRVELRISGWSAVDILVNRRGQGRYHLSDPLPTGMDGSFSVRPEQFAGLLERLKPFQKHALPLTDKSAQDFVDGRCPEGMPFVTDAGAIWVRWTGPNLDEHVLADLGCDAERNAFRNKELLETVKSLPVPLG